MKEFIVQIDETKVPVEFIEQMQIRWTELIRCKDCKWCVENYWLCKNWNGGTDSDGYCFEAERKE